MTKEDATICKATKSVTFDLLVLEIMLLIFKNTVIYLNFVYTFFQLCMFSFVEP